jgi:ABC-type antimicrobial peptide transport system permease subunit
VLALAAVTAAISSALRRRRGEVVVLRAVGLSGRQQAWSRRLEVIGVSVAAAVFGLAGGVVVVLLVGNTLARLSVVTAPSTLSVQGRVDPVGMAAGVAIVAIALAAAIWVYGGAVRRQAADTAYREETR